MSSVVQQAGLLPRSTVSAFSSSWGVLAAKSRALGKKFTFLDFRQIEERRHLSDKCYVRPAIGSRRLRLFVLSSVVCNFFEGCTFIGIVVVECTSVQIRVSSFLLFPEKVKLLLGAWRSKFLSRKKTLSRKFLAIFCYLSLANCRSESLIGY